MRHPAIRYGILLSRVLAVLAGMALPSLAQGPAPRRLGEVADAYVATDGDGWTIGSSAIAYSVGFDARGLLVARALRLSEGGRSWQPAPQRDSLFRADGGERSLTRSDPRGFRFDRAEVLEAAGGLQLRLVFESAADGLRATRIYAAYPSVSAIEVWTEIEATTGRPVILSELVTLQLVVDGSDLTWVRGLEAPAEAGGAFAVERRTVGEGESAAIEARHRSTQYALPVIAAGGPGGTFFAGLLWSGSWRIDLVGQPGGRVEATLWLPDTETTVSEARPVVLPRAVFGAAPGDEGAVAPALHGFIVGALRRGRALEPLVTFNTWFVTGTGVREDVVIQQMREAAAVGVELFQLDAGWYEGAGERGIFDFHSGLGTYRVDREKFPRGLRPLGEMARSLGMRFGLWVEPERVDLRSVGAPGMAQEAWLARQDGFYEPGVPDEAARTGQLDLGNPEARAWLLEKLTTLVQDTGADYLKWDNNLWVENTRAVEGRGPRDGNFAHVTGLYQVLEQLRARFPSLLIENCAGGGNRLDLGLLRYTDAGWMDDRTSPSRHVRHNLQGLTTFLPPAYLLSYLISHPDEPMHLAPDMKLYARSRMAGVFGLSFPTGELSEGDRHAVLEEVEIWKAHRDILRRSSAVRLTGQAAGPAAPPWDAIALVTPGRDEALVFAFQNDAGTERAAVRLRGLDPAATYRIHSVRVGDMGQATGAVLMERGIEFVEARDTAARLLRLNRVGEVTPR